MLGVQSLGPARISDAAELVAEPGRSVSELAGEREGVHARWSCYSYGSDPERTSPGPFDASGAAGRCETSGNEVGRRAAAVREDPRASSDASCSERDAWVTLLAVPGLGPVTFASLLRTFGSARAVLDTAASPAGLVGIEEALGDPSHGEGGACGTRDRQGVTPEIRVEDTPGDPDAAVAGRNRPDLESSRRRWRPGLGVDLARRIGDASEIAGRTLRLVRELGLTVVTLDDSTYPSRLRQIEMPPPLLFVRGDITSLEQSSAVAVVGTRRATDKGRLLTGWIAAGLARAGAAVVSGLAVGIDGAAHAAVVGEGGLTVAVLGSGHARLFPRAHERLADVIVEAGGAVVSELPPEVEASRGTFPRRNRLVSGLSDAVVVVEAGERSGALITAGWALEQGRDCFLVPGAIDSPASLGCNAFLRSFPGQARVVCGVAELIEDLGLSEGMGVGVDGDASAGAAADQPREGAAESERRSRALAARPVEDVDRPDCSATPRVDQAAATAAEPSTAKAATNRARSRADRKPKGTAGRAPGATTAGVALGAVISSLGPAERTLAQLIVHGPLTADDLAERSSLPAASVLSALTLLELRGLVSSSYGRYLPAGILARGPGRPSPMGR